MICNAEMNIQQHAALSLVARRMEPTAFDILKDLMGTAHSDVLHLQLSILPAPTEDSDTEKESETMKIDIEGHVEFDAIGAGLRWKQIPKLKWNGNNEDGSAFRDFTLFLHRCMLYCADTVLPFQSFFGFMEKRVGAVEEEKIDEITFPPSGRKPYRTDWANEIAKLKRRYRSLFLGHLHEQGASRNAKVAAEAFYHDFMILLRVLGEELGEQQSKRNLFYNLLMSSSDEKEFQEEYDAMFYFLSSSTMNALITLSSPEVFKTIVGKSVWRFQTKQKEAVFNLRLSAFMASMKLVFKNNSVFCEAEGNFQSDFYTVPTFSPVYLDFGPRDNRKTVSFGINALANLDDMFENEILHGSKSIVCSGLGMGPVTASILFYPVGSNNSPIAKLSLSGIMRYESGSFRFDTHFREFDSGFGNSWHSFADRLFRLRLLKFLNAYGVPDNVRQKVSMSARDPFKNLGADADEMRSLFGNMSTQQFLSEGEWEFKGGDAQVSYPGPDPATRYRIVFNGKTYGVKFGSLTDAKKAAVTGVRVQLHMTNFKDSQSVIAGHASSSSVFSALSPAVSSIVQKVHAESRAQSILSKAHGLRSIRSSQVPPARDGREREDRADKYNKTSDTTFLTTRSSMSRRARTMIHRLPRDLM